ncbi:MAG: SRPBCC domain-containing protein [Methanomassiliicoccus sp.]|nr:SRPBCC domain-containing protein [Methanomassiliicoccus sp.]
MSPETSKIYQKVMLPAPPEVIYDMLTDPVRLSEMTGLAVEGKAEAGGRMIVGDGRIIFRFLELERGRWISQEWTTSDWPGGVLPSKVEIGLRAIGQGTDLRLSHTGVPLALRDGINQLWYDAYWNPMFELLRSRALY